MVGGRAPSVKQCMKRDAKRGANISLELSGEAIRARGFAHRKGLNNRKDLVRGDWMHQMQSLLIQEPAQSNWVKERGQGLWIKIGR